MPPFPIIIVCPVLTASLTSFSTTQAMPTPHPVWQSRRGGRVERYSWCWGPKHPQNACVKPTALLQSSLAWSCGHSGTGVWRTSGALLACLFPFGFIWKQPSLLRLRQLCDRNQGVVIMWPFKGTFVPHPNYNLGGYIYGPCQHLGWTVRSTGLIPCFSYLGQEDQCMGSLSLVTELNLAYLTISSLLCAAVLL